MKQEEGEEHWLVDSGSIMHVTNKVEDMKNWANIYETIIVKNGEKVEVNLMGMIHLQIGDAVLTLHEVLYVS